MTEFSFDLAKALDKIDQNTWMRKAIECGAAQIHDTWIFNNPKGYTRFVEWVKEYSDA